MSFCTFRFFSISNKRKHIVILHYKSHKIGQTNTKKFCDNPYLSFGKKFGSSFQFFFFVLYTFHHRIFLLPPSSDTHTHTHTHTHTNTHTLSCSLHFFCNWDSHGLNDVTKSTQVIFLFRSNFFPSSLHFPPSESFWNFLGYSPRTRTFLPTPLLCD